MDPVEALGTRPVTDAVPFPLGDVTVSIGTDGARVKLSEHQRSILTVQRLQDIINDPKVTDKASFDTAMRQYEKEIEQTVEALQRHPDAIQRFIDSMKLTLVGGAAAAAVGSPLLPVALLGVLGVAYGARTTRNTWRRMRKAMAAGLKHLTDYVQPEGEVAVHGGLNSRSGGPRKKPVAARTPRSDSRTLATTRVRNLGRVARSSRAAQLARAARLAK
jgi:hypothetical protein